MDPTEYNRLSNYDPTIRRLGHRMRKALDFATKYPGWYTFDTERATKSAIERLQRRGLVEINEFGQFRLMQR